MFANLTRPKKVPRRRQAGAALMAFLISSSLAGAGLLAGGQQVVEWPDEPDEPLVVEVVLDEAPLPAPPGPAGGAQQAEQVEQPPVQEPPVEDEVVEEEPVDEAEEPEDAVAELDPVSIESTPISNGLLEDGSGGGGGGSCESPPCGPCTGPDCGTSTTPGTGGPMSVQGLEPRRTVEPRYPKAAHELGLPSTRCVARFTVDKKGRPTDVQLQSCPSVFREATLEAAWAWRFWPARVDGRAVESTFLVAFTFTPR